MSGTETVDGIVPGEVSVPGTIEDLAATLQSASRARRTTIVSGGGTKIGWGRPPAQVDLIVRTKRLSRILAHRYGDLTATIEAGAALVDVNRQLAHHGQWLPLDSAFDRATIGGIVATNDSGPLRHRFGTPRDLLIGVTLALTDGRLVKAGGTVVKNVAGYDLGRLMSGSFGTLAAITSATFKLSPLPAASGSLGVLYDDPAVMAREALNLGSQQFEITAFDVQMTPGATAGSEFRLLVRFASSPAATEAQLVAARSLVSGDADVIRGAAEVELWNDQVRAPWIGHGATIRCSWLPANLSKVLALLDDVRQRTGATLTFTGRIGVGAGLLRIDGSVEARVAVIEHLRTRHAVVGNVVVLRADGEVKRKVDVWGEPGDTAKVLSALKRTFDPEGILNAGRGPI